MNGELKMVSGIPCVRNNDGKKQLLHSSQSVVSSTSASTRRVFGENVWTSETWFIWITKLARSMLRGITIGIVTQIGF